MNTLSCFGAKVSGSKVAHLRPAEHSASSRLPQAGSGSRNPDSAEKLGSKLQLALTIALSQSAPAALGANSLFFHALFP